MKKKFGRIDSKHENNYEDFRENVNPFFLPRPWRHLRMTPIEEMSQLWDQKQNKYVLR